TFSAAYSGNLHLYASDWAGIDRRETVTVNDGSGPRSASLSVNFHDGAWIHFPISITAGGTVTITVDRLAGPNAIINGVFLGEGSLPPPDRPSAPQTLSASPGSAGVALTWAAPTSNGGGGITNNKAYRGTARD